MSGVVKYIGNVKGGLCTRYSETNIQDDQFSKLRNMISWHGSVQTKAGTSKLGQLAVPYNLAGITLNGSGTVSFSFWSIINIAQPTGATLSQNGLSFTDGTHTWVAPSTPDGTLLIGTTVSGSINYVTGAITLSGGTANASVTGSVYVYYGQPVLGFSVWTNPTTQNPTQLIFDQNRCYTFLGGTNQDILSTSSIYLSSNNSCTWSGQSYQLFQSTNVAGADFISNQTAGMQLASISGMTTGGSTFVTTSSPHQLILNDVVWFNEVNGVNGINGATGTVINVNSTTSFTVNISTSGSYISGSGIFQYLTSNKVFPTRDGLRYFYSGGFVNYAPPTSSSLAPTYICGCKTLIYFGGRLCLFGVYIATSSQALAGVFTYVPNAVYYSSLIGLEVGSPFYTSLNPVGINYVNAGAFYTTSPSQYGGYLLFPSTSGISSAQLWKLQYVVVSFFGADIYRFEATSSPVFPFIVNLLSSQFGGSGVGASISLSEYVLVVSKNGIVATSASSADRIDFDVPDIVGSIAYESNAASRLISCVDNSLEAVFFTFPSQQNSSPNSPFNDTTLFFNYRENTWALLDEHFCSYGKLIYVSGNGNTYGSMTKPWSSYTQPWTPLNKGLNNIIVACGNQQGYIFSRSLQKSGAGNDYSLTISSIGVSGGNVALTVYNHNLNVGQYIYINNCIGTYGGLLNDSNFRVISVTSSSVFVIQATVTGSLTYLGLGQIQLVDIPVVQTKTFTLAEKGFMGTAVSRIALQVRNSGEGSFSFYPVANTSVVPSNVPGQTYVPTYNSSSLKVSPSPNMGTNALEVQQTYLWKKLSVKINGNCVSLLVTKSAEQMGNKSNNNLFLEINALCMQVEASGNMFSV